MQAPLKILVIRFSSIGDIILTTPLLRSLKTQLNCDIDYLTKSQHKVILLSNINIRDIFALEGDSGIRIDLLKRKEYDIIIDLQNNFRSLKIRLALRVKSYVISKENIKRYLLIYFGIHFLNNHIVDRYFKTVEKLDILNDNNGIDFLLSAIPKLSFNIDQNYIAWCIGGSYDPKKLAVAQISDVINKLEIPIVLIGGQKEEEIAAAIINATNSDDIYNFCGKTSIDTSAYLIKNSNLVLTNDTGMMHIASAFDSPIISFWGCTKPSLGFSAYMPNTKSQNIVVKKSKRPCSKHGKYCRFQKKGCIKDIDAKTIYRTVSSLLK